MVEPEILVARRPGWRKSGADRGDLRHAVPVGRGAYGKSLCGVVPGANSKGWDPARSGARVTCLACSKVAARPAAKARAQAERFWSKCAIEPDGGCWLWTRCTFSNGYGKYTFGGRTHYAHRLAYEMHHGVSPGQAFVCHRCDNPPCINPEHLWLGTARDNALDMHAKGRNRTTPRQGEAHHANKLEERDVIIMRLLAEWLGVPLCRIASMHGVSYMQAKRVVAREAWSHVA